ncbi:protein-disulfide reductase DsbD family protein [Tistrella bauzanensis]|uniref:protein-disulfide reductase DsbD family protein n=1 Tax=Tistrella TaxID=171436 RepID=UPI0031F664EA
MSSTRPVPPTRPALRRHGQRIRPWHALMALVLLVVLMLVSAVLANAAESGDAQTDIASGTGPSAGEVSRGWLGPWVEGPQSAVRLVVAPPVPGGGAAAGAVMAGLDFRMAPGWKLYWRSPGDAGLPPAIDTTASPQIGDARILWPLPERFTAFDTIHTYAYADRVLLPVRLRQSAEAPLRLTVDYQVCEALCIPVRADLALDAPSGAADPLDRTAQEARALVDAGLARVPPVVVDAVASPFAAVSAGLVDARADRPARLVVEAKSVEGFGLDADVFIEGPDGFAFTPPERRLLGDGHTARFVSEVLPPTADARLLGETLRLTLVDPRSDVAALRAVETTAQVVPAPATLLGPEGGLIAAVLIGLAGGLILNIMPCVLPVLSIKLMGLVAARGLSRGHVRVSLLATAAGIILSFLALAALALGLKTAGIAVGWGVQFQQPVFIGLMILAMALFAASQLGAFTIRAPTLAGGLAREAVGQGGPRPGQALISGVVATLLATPCSAPFVGTALGFALAGGTGDILAVFLALGIGMALPYLLIAAVPAAIRLLPRPGRWMLWVKTAMGLGLAGTAIWLGFVLADLVGPGPAAAVVALAALAAALPAVIAKARLLRWAGVAGLATAAIAIAALAPPPAARGFQALAADGPWVPFQPDTIAGEVAAGRVVFVDVTASWCVTCIVNEERVLTVDPVASRIADPAVVAMKADWTRPDPAISAYLAGFGRYGIPFNVVYGPAAPQGLVLPELLTADAVTGAIARAAASPGASGG